MGNPRKAVFPNPQVTNNAVCEPAESRFFILHILTNTQAPAHTSKGPITGRSIFLPHSIPEIYLKISAGKATYIIQALMPL